MYDESGPRPPGGTDLEDVVAIEFPATTRYVAVTRVAAAGLVADLDPDLEEVENLRIAVNELVSLLVDSADGGTVRLELRLDGNNLDVSAKASNLAAPDRAGRPDREDPGGHRDELRAR